MPRRGLVKLLRLVLRGIWLRGFLPAVVLLVVWGVSTFVHTVWQTGGAQPWRGAVTQGVVMVDWPTSRRWPGWGTVQWSLGTMKTASGGNASGVWVSNYFPQFTAEWDAEVRSGHVKIPIVYLSAVCAAAAGLACIVTREIRRRRPLPGHCRQCGYDLRAGVGEKCPECGEVVAKAE